MAEETQRHLPLTCDNDYNLLMSMLHVSVSRHILDEHFSLIWANSYYYELIGYSPDEYVSLFHNQCDRFFVPNPQDWGTIAQAVLSAQARHQRSYECVTRFRRKSGLYIWVRVAGTFTDETMDGAPVVYTVITDITDITEQRELLRQSNEELETLAYVDEVTGGWNRNRFELSAQAAIRSHAPGSYALVSVDIQKFKVINDLFGIEMGDRILKYFHDTLCAELAEDEYVGRISADNFNLLLHADTAAALERRMQLIAGALNRFNLQLKQKYLLSLTAGIYIISEPELPIIKLRDRANVARKNGKTDGNAASLCTCFFYSDLDRLCLMREKEVENRMQDALERGEFLIYLQPKVDLHNGMITSAEALVRWQDPERGLVPPNEFIPFFEKNGFIVEIDLCVFEQVCALQRRWLDEGRSPLRISVNMSRVHLSRADYLERYEEIRQKYRVPPELLEIELTETLIFKEPEALIPVINRIHALGYRCSIDDFGSGYSSLNILKDLDVDTLKLDRVFFNSQQEGNPRALDVVRFVVDLARRLDMRTVAEGVETRAQMDFLRSVNCDYVQGYAFSRPLPPDEFEALAFASPSCPLPQL